jgi:hypothetical protein
MGSEALAQGMNFGANTAASAVEGQGEYTKAQDAKKQLDFQNALLKQDNLNKIVEVTLKAEKHNADIDEMGYRLGKSPDEVNGIKQQLNQARISLAQNHEDTVNPDGKINQLQTQQPQQPGFQMNYDPNAGVVDARDQAREVIQTEGYISKREKALLEARTREHVASTRPSYDPAGKVAVNPVVDAFLKSKIERINEQKARSKITGFDPKPGSSAYKKWEIAAAEQEISDVRNYINSVRRDPGGRNVPSYPIPWDVWINHPEIQKITPPKIKELTEQMHRQETADARTWDLQNPTPVGAESNATSFASTAPTTGGRVPTSTTPAPSLLPSPMTPERDPAAVNPKILEYKNSQMVQGSTDDLTKYVFSEKSIPGLYLESKSRNSRLKSALDWIDSSDFNESPEMKSALKEALIEKIRSRQDKQVDSTVNKMMKSRPGSK